MWKYNKLSDVQIALLKKNIIDLQGSTDGEMAFYVREAIARLISVGSPNVTITITSDGGSVDAGLDIYDFIRLYPGKTTGKVVGYARSMAAIILQACDKRLCSKQARILIHHINRGKITLDELRSKKKLSKISKYMELDQERLYNILCEITKKKKKNIVATCAKDTDMTAKEAKKFNLIDEII